MSAVYLIRHAQASFGAAEYDQLSELGVEQSRVLGAALRERADEVQAVFTGTQRRHRQTALACLAELGFAEPARELHGFDEFDHDETLVRFEPRYADRSQLAADLLGQEAPRRAFQEVFAKAVARWTGGGHDSEYSESWPAFRRRCLAALEVVTGATGASQAALVFTSGGPITAICQELLGLADAAAFRVSWSLVNCGITKVLRGPRGLRLSTLNEHAHFEGGRRVLLTYR